MRTIPKPVIAAVNGPAVGIGCSLALAADLIVAARSAYFLLAFVNIGLGLDGGASQTLTARVGHARAFEMAYLGERIAAEQALDWGMINRSSTTTSCEPTVGRAGRAAGGRAARAPTPRSSARSTTAPTPGSRSCSSSRRSLQQERAESRDFIEGVLAFMQKRPADVHRASEPVLTPSSELRHEPRPDPHRPAPSAIPSTSRSSSTTSS